MKLRIPRIGRRRLAPPPIPSRAKTRQKYGPEGKPARTRAQLEDRAERRPISPQLGARQTASDLPSIRGGRAGGHGTRNYPPRPETLRRKDSTEPTRSQLAQRRATRAAQGHPASKPHPTSGEGARASYKARGAAKRPASDLRDPHATPGAPIGKHRHRPDPGPGGQGGGFPGWFFGRPPANMSGAGASSDRMGR